MQNHYDTFKTTLKQFVEELNNIIPNKDINNVLSVYNKLNMKRVMKRFLNTMKPFKNDIVNENQNMFTNDIMILPKINLKVFWTQANEEQEQRFWVFLKYLYILSELCINTDNSVMGDNLNNTESESNQEFNPYVGVGPDTDTSNSSSSYDVGKMFTGVDNKPEINTGIESMAQMLGVDLNKLTDELKNMGSDDVDEATNNIMGMLGTEVDSKTTSAISEMLSNISSELKTKDMSKDNLFENISGIAKSVAKKMKPKVDSGELDINNILASTQNITSQYVGDVSDNSDFNPVNLLNNLMNNQQTKNTPSEK